MFTEIATARTHSQGYRRLWFQSATMDLYVWYGASGAPIGFQLAYDRRGNQRAITWIREQGLFHARVDEGRRERLAGTALLKPDSEVDVARVLAQFLEDARHLDPTITILVTNRLRGYLAGTQGGPARWLPRIVLAAVAGAILGVLLTRG